MNDTDLTISDRLIVEVFDGDDVLVARYVGYSQRQLLLQHQHGECQWDCGYCYSEASEYLANAESKLAVPPIF